MQLSLHGGISIIKKLPISKLTHYFSMICVHFFGGGIGSLLSFFVFARETSRGDSELTDSLICVTRTDFPFNLN